MITAENGSLWAPDYTIAPEGVKTFYSGAAEMGLVYLRVKAEGPARVHSLLNVTIHD